MNMSNLLLGVRTSLYEFRKITLEKVDFDSKIENFKLEVSKKANIPKDNLELVFCGNILSDESTLRDNGVKPGVMIHVLKKKKKDVSHGTQPMSEADFEALVLAFRTLTLVPYRTSLHKLSRPEVLDNIIMITPGLSQDPVAVSIIQDPELLVRMGDRETLRRVVELHPALAEAANHIVATAHEEAASSSNCGPSTSSGFSQLMDVLSDEDDMESSQSSDSVQQGVSRQQSFSAITPAQLAAALASASQGPSSSSAATAAGGTGSSAGGGGSGEVSAAITPEMVNEAMQRAMATVAAPRAEVNSEVTASSSQGGNNNDFREQMRQMRELGLTDDVINLQALQLAGGNVHAAVDLVFSGAISSER